MDNYYKPDPMLSVIHPELYEFQCLRWHEMYLAEEESNVNKGLMSPVFE